MKRKLPPFPALRAFEAAARLGAVKDAAEELCVTPSAISHQVRVLEGFLGRSLFRRDGRGQVLTADGRAYLREVGPLLDRLDASTRQITGEICAGPLHVKMTESFAKRWLIPRLPRLVARHPALELRIETGMPWAEFKGGAPDVVIMWGDEPLPGVVVDPFMSSGRTPVCSPEFLARNPDLADPLALAQKTLLRDEYDDGWADWFRAAGAPGRCPAGGPVFTHCELAMTAAENGVGVALGYTDMIGETLTAADLVAPFDIDVPTRTIYSLAYESARAGEARIVAFRDWLLEEILFDGVVAGRHLPAAQ